MNHDLSVLSQRHIALLVFLFLTVLSLMFPISSTAENKTSAAEELISLSAKDEPLGDVLYKVSVATGYDISLDNKWQNYRVTASFKEVSLHKGLKRILRNLNNAIIYVSSKKIKIIIYDKTTSESATYDPSAEKPLDKTPIVHRPSYDPSEPQIPASQAIEKEDTSETDEEPAEISGVSDQESETSTQDGEGEEKTKPENDESGPDEETNKNLKDKSSEESYE